MFEMWKVWNNSLLNTYDSHQQFVALKSKSRIKILIFYNYVANISVDGNKPQIKLRYMYNVKCDIYIYIYVTD